MTLISWFFSSKRKDTGLFESSDKSFSGLKYKSKR